MTEKLKEKYIVFFPVTNVSLHTKETVFQF